MWNLVQLKGAYNYFKVGMRELGSCDSQLSQKLKHNNYYGYIYMTMVSCRNFVWFVCRVVKYLKCTISSKLLHADLYINECIH